jgi:hypothetical protein
VTHHTDLCHKRVILVHYIHGWSCKHQRGEAGVIIESVTSYGVNKELYRVKWDGSDHLCHVFPYEVEIVS